MYVMDGTWLNCSKPTIIKNNRDKMQKYRYIIKKKMGGYPIMI